MDTSPASDTGSEPFDVWIVEDNDVLRETYAALLNDDPGMRCGGSFRTCEDALGRMQHLPPPDLVLLDIELPGMNGIEGARRMHARSPTTRIVMLTIHEDRENVFRALCAGATGYIVKPSSAEGVLAAIAELRGGGVPMSAQIARRVLEIFQRWSATAREYGLTVREMEVLRLLVDGSGQKQIAARLALSQHTVNSHIRNIYAKLHVHSRGTAVAKALNEHLV